MKKCKVCKEGFTPQYSSIEPVCKNYDCRVAFALKTAEKQKLTKEKKVRQEKSALREKLKGIPELKKELEKEINKICCEIDKFAGCISCNGNTTPQAGHYHTVQSNGAIRFNLDNLHMQDYNCNCAKGGNIHQYDLGLIERYGKDYWEYVKFDLVQKFPLLKMAVFEYQEKISKARSIVKWLKLQDKRYTDLERLELRKKYNKELEIYK